MNETPHSAPDEHGVAENAVQSPAHTTASVASAPSARKGRRLPLEFPVIVRVEQENGEAVRYNTNTLSVSVNGALLSVPAPLPLNQRLFLTNAKTTQEVECAVRSIREKKGIHQIGVEFQAWLPEFWEITFPREDGDPLPEPPASDQPRLQKRVFGHVGPMPELPFVEETSLTADTGVETQLKRVGLSGSKKYLLLLAPALIIAALWFVFRPGTEAAPVAAPPAPLPQEVARALPNTAGFHVATAADFIPQASAFVHQLAQPVSGKISGHFTPNGESTAYIMLNNDKSWRVSIIENGQLRCDARYKSVAIAARVPHGLIRRIKWSDGFSAEPDGDGLLIVRSAAQTNSGVILFLQGADVISGSPADYEQIPLVQDR